MLIKCKQCNHENQLGAIFCRGCGGKLELDAMRPEIKEKKSGQGCFKIGCKLFIVGFLLFFIGSLVAFLFPFNYTEYEEFPKDKQAEVDQMVTDLEMTLAGNNNKRMYLFTPEQATYAINHAMEEYGVSNAPKVIIEIDDGIAKVIFQKKLLSVLRVRFEVTGAPKLEREDGDTILELDLQSVQFGNVPLPGLETLIEQAIQDALDKNEELLTAIDMIQKFEIDADNMILLVLKKPKKAKK